MGFEMSRISPSFDDRSLPEEIPVAGLEGGLAGAVTSTGRSSTPHRYEPVEMRDQIDVEIVGYPYRGLVNLDLSF